MLDRVFSHVLIGDICAPRLLIQLQRTCSLGISPPKMMPVGTVGTPYSLQNDGLAHPTSPPFPSEESLALDLSRSLHCSLIFTVLHFMLAAVSYAIHFVRSSLHPWIPSRLEFCVASGERAVAACRLLLARKEVADMVDGLSSAARVAKDLFFISADWTAQWAEDQLDIKNDHCTRKGSIAGLITERIIEDELSSIFWRLWWVVSVAFGEVAGGIRERILGGGGVVRWLLSGCGVAWLVIRIWRETISFFVQCAERILGLQPTAGEQKGLLMGIVGPENGAVAWRAFCVGEVVTLCVACKIGIVACDSNGSDDKTASSESAFPKEEGEEMKSPTSVKKMALLFGGVLSIKK